MNDTHICLKEAEWAKLWEKLDHIQNKLCAHVVEGEKSGGWRDRLLILEKEVEVIKKGYWKACLVAGMLGGMLGKLAPDLFELVAKYLLK